MLTAIYNVWDGVELLRGSMTCLKNHVDHFIIVHQALSNYGEHYDPVPDMDLSGFDNVTLIQYIPEVIKSQKTGRANEARKRNLGIKTALKMGATHFINMDVDEYYEDFGAAKEMYFQSGHAGSVCRMYTYFQRPTLRLETPENYYVPFIHELNNDTHCGAYPYPYHVDPTRKVNEKDVIELPIFMHHYSWVRQDIGRKVRNSSAKNLSQHLKDHEIAYAGMHLKCYPQRLIEVENIFGV